MVVITTPRTWTRATAGRRRQHRYGPRLPAAGRPWTCRDGGGGGRGRGRGGTTPRKRKLAGGDAASTPDRGGGGWQNAASSSDPVELCHAVPEPASHHKRGRRRRRRQRRGQRTGRRERRDGGAPPLATVASATDLLWPPIANRKYLRFSISLSIFLTIPSKIVPQHKGQTLKFFD